MQWFVSVLFSILCISNMKLPLRSSIKSSTFAKPLHAQPAPCVGYLIACSSICINLVLQQSDCLRSHQSNPTPSQAIKHPTHLIARENLIFETGWTAPNTRHPQTIKEPTRHSRWRTKSTTGKWLHVSNRTLWNSAHFIVRLESTMEPRRTEVRSASSFRQFIQKHPGPLACERSADLLANAGWWFWMRHRFWLAQLHLYG